MLLIALSTLSACKKDPQTTCEAVLSLDADTLSLSGDCGSLSLSPMIVGEGALSVSLTLEGAQVTPTITAGSGGGTLSALALTGPVSLTGEQPARLWRQGYQSWWWSGVTDLTDMELTDEGLPRVGGDGNGTSATDETPWSSWWVGLLGRSDGASVLLGALGTARLKFTTAWVADTAWAVWGGRGERIALSEGDTLTLDPLWLGMDTDAFGLHRQYAAAAADHHGVSPRTDSPPVGWATWYTFYEDVTEEQVRDNLDVAVTAATRESLADLEVFQIDDGWEVAWGEWSANERFPSGMEALAADITAAGFTPGLWLAPFYADTGTAVFIDHDDWWVRDDDGAVITFSNFGSGDYAILDVTHPDAADWLSGQIADRVAEGWTYLKLDFLYAGAQEGTRQQDVTGMEAFHLGMSIMKAAAGDAFILACGAPMLPSLGYADAYRTGADIAFNFDPDPEPAYLRWQARATAARSWQNGLWWWIDPDQIIIREPFDETEVSGALVANIVSGGAWLLGDDLTTLPDDRLSAALDAALVATAGLVGEPVDPLASPSGMDLGPVAELNDSDDAVPMVWHLSDGGTALLNLSEHTVTVDGPGGVELLSGESAGAGPRELASGMGEVWY
jgi:alpha-galactosidase